MPKNGPKLQQTEPKTESTKAPRALPVGRRAFLKTSAAVGAAASVGYWTAGGVSASPRYRSALDGINFASVGVGGKGAEDCSSLGKLGNMVALCDIDDRFLDAKSKEFPTAERFNDYREMLDQMGDSIDAVSVSTPDHTHAVIALAAMRAGKHVYCQKPLTHSIEEARMMSTVAAERDIVTQMGNQGTASSVLRKSAALIRAGVIGDVNELHVWTNRPVWPQAKDLKVNYEDCPDSIRWDLWLGPAEQRDFSYEIHPFKWRGFWDFGTGALGDMACHTLNMPFMALDMRTPRQVVAETDGHDGNSFPKWSRITYTFERQDAEPLTFYWYDGSQLPPEELMEHLPRNISNGGKHFSSAALLVGANGNYYAPGDYGFDRRNSGIVADGEFTPMRDIVEEVEIVRSPGIYKEFAAAINGEMETVSNFHQYAGPLTEVVLLGNLAVLDESREVNWDAERMEATDATEAQQRLIRHEYHNGFTIHEASPDGGQQPAPAESDDATSGGNSDEAGRSNQPEGELVPAE